MRSPLGSSTAASSMSVTASRTPIETPFDVLPVIFAAPRIVVNRGESSWSPSVSMNRFESSAENCGARPMRRE